MCVSKEQVSANYFVDAVPFLPALRDQHNLGQSLFFLSYERVNNLNDNANESKKSQGNGVERKRERKRKRKRDRQGESE